MATSNLRKRGIEKGMVQQPLIYAFVARDTEKLVEYTEFTGNFNTIAHRCLTKLPTGNKFAYNCNGYTLDYLVEDGLTYCVVAAESVGRQVPVAFLDRVKKDFTTRYGITANANRCYQEFSLKLKGHIQYCMDHQERIKKLAKVKEQSSESSGVVVESIEKVLNCGEKLDILVSNTENLHSEVGSTKRKKIFLSDEDVIDSSQEMVESLKLYHGTYYTSSYEVDVLINKGQELRTTYDKMKGLQLNSLIPYLNFYPEAGQGRLVMAAMVKISLSWLKDVGHKLLIDADGNMTQLFKNMMIDICDLVQYLCSKKIKIKNLNKHNLYMANEISPRILVLVSEFECLGSDGDNMGIWTPVQDVLKWCFQECKAEPTRHSARLLQFICSEYFSVKSLKRYPDNWDDTTKEEYLLATIAADQKADVQSAVNKSSRITWPSENEGLPSLLKLIKQDLRKKGWKYRKKNKYDYIKLIRDVHKHLFDLPLHIQEQCGKSRQGFLRVVEKWSPNIWVDLFDTIGWP